jgi:DNA-binding response OmpR family regulator
MRKGTLATLDVPPPVLERPVLERPVPAPRILVVDDEPRIRDFVSRALTAAGYLVEVACDGASAMARAAGGGFALVVLDLVMPGLDGQAVLAELIRRQPDQAVLVLSCLEDVPTKVACLEFGAKDYLTKPFSLDELLARIRARLRGDGHPAGDVIRAGELTLDIWRLRADIGAGPVELTRLEFLLLRELMEHPGTSVPKEQLLASVWGLQFDPGSNVVDVCVRRLRSKLGFETIKTVRGEGYQLAIS